MGRPKGSKNHTADGEALRNSVDGAELRALIERIENVNALIADLITNDRRELYAEVKATGYDPSIVRMIIKDRAMDFDKKQRRDDLLEQYRSALGAFVETPLGAAALEHALRASV